MELLFYLLRLLVELEDKRGTMLAIEESVRLLVFQVHVHL
jgi:hypothetical protein